MYKGYPFSRTTYYKRLKLARELGCDIMDVPSRRGKHGNHAKGNKHYRWNEEKHSSTEGYAKIRVGVTHPLSDPNGYAYEHKLVWVSAGHSIETDEVLHHINGNKQDNRLENLEKMTRSQHNILHLPTREKDTGRFAKEN